MPTVVLNLTQKISAIIRPLRQSLPSERSLRSAHRLSAEPRSKTNTCGPMSTRKGQAGRICNAPSSRTAALGIGPYIRGGEDGRIGSSVPTFQTEKTPLAVPAHSQGRKLRGTTLIRSVCRSSLQPLTELARPAYYKRSPVLIVCGLRRIFCPDPSV